jgi:hypothetical protein
MHVMVRPVGEGRAVALTGDTANAETDPRWFPTAAECSFSPAEGCGARPPAADRLGPSCPKPGQSGAHGGLVTRRKRLVFSRGDSLLLREADASVHGWHD